MTGKTFLNKLANGEADVIQIFLDMIEKKGIDYCLIDGLAVNAYTKPVVSLDLDMVVAVSDIDKLCKEAGNEFTIERFAHSVNLKSHKSDIRIQLQTDPRYQKFIKNAKERKVMEYNIRVASLEDVLQGKIWAYSDDKRRESKKQKDLADIYRLVEDYPRLNTLLPKVLKNKIKLE